MRAFIKKLTITGMALAALSAPAMAEDNATAFWGAAQAEWGRNFSPDDVQLLHQDVTCDGQPDYIGGYLNLDDPDNDWYQVMLVTTDGDGNPHAEPVALSYGPAGEYALCGTPGEDEPPQLSVFQWSEEAISEAFSGEYAVCDQAIVIDDGLCDRVHLLWLPDSTEGEPRFVAYQH